MKLLYVGSLLFAASGMPLAVEVDSYTKAFSDITDKFGLWAAIATVLMVVIIATAWIRERRMAKRIDDLEAAFVEAVKQQKDVQAALHAETRVLEDLAEETKTQTDVLKRIEIIFAQKTCPFNGSGKK